MFVFGVRRVLRVFEVYSLRVGFVLAGWVGWFMFGVLLIDVCVWFDCCWG